MAARARSGSTCEPKGVESAGRPVDVHAVDRRVIWLCVVAGSTAGGLVPEAWGGSVFGVLSFALGLVGGLAGLWLGVRLAVGP